MTLNELAYNIRNIAYKGQGDSDDTKLNIRQIKFWINQHRASAIFQATDWGKDLPPTYFQDLGVVPLSDVDKSDSSCPSVPWGCEIKKVELPQLIQFPQYRGLWVGLIDKQTPLQIDNPDTHFFTSQTRFGQNFTRVYMIKNTLYVVTKNGFEDMEYINVRGVFENPEEVMQWSTPGCEPVVCNLDDEPYPMDASMYEIILRKILSTELNMTLQTVNDVINNNQFDGDIRLQ